MVTKVNIQNNDAHIINTLCQTEEITLIIPIFQHKPIVIL